MTSSKRSNRNRTYAKTEVTMGEQNLNKEFLQGNSKFYSTQD